jgi:hypothetical protein
VEGEGSGWRDLSGWHPCAIELLIAVEGMCAAKIAQCWGTARSSSRAGAHAIRVLGEEILVGAAGARPDALATCCGAGRAVSCLLFG